MITKAAVVSQLACWRHVVLAGIIPQMKSRTGSSAAKINPKALRRCSQASTREKMGAM
jgi:hypothetical protein